MKRIFWILTVIASVAIIASAIGYAQTPPPAPDDDIDWLSDFDLDGPGMGLGGGPGMGNGIPRNVNGGPGMGNGGPRNGKGGPGMGGPGMGRGPAERQQALERMKKEDPERYNRLMKIRQLSDEYRASSDPKRKAAIEKEIRPLVDKELRIQHENNKKRVADMERRVGSAKKALEDREKNWDQVVDFSVKEVTGQNDYLHAWRPGRGPRQQ